MLTVPPKTNSGATMRIKGRGFTGKNGERGDQLVTVMIHLPTDADALATIADILADDISIRAELNV
jgi:DnaJ-class molecular chaperone